MKKKYNNYNKDIDKIIYILKNLYPDAKCSLVYNSPLELLIAGRLSSQCTDNRVNIVTKTLFNKYKTLEDFADANLEDIKQIIKPCGLFNKKAENIINLSKTIIKDFNNQIPDNIDELIKLPGIGRKTANLVVGEIFKKPAIICDTHCIRITNLLGLSFSKDPVKVEKELRLVLPEKESCLFCHMIVYHGRKICKARKPDCPECHIKNYCQFYKNIKSENLE